MTDDLTQIRELHERVWQAYKGEIYDWCGHVLAIEITADKMHMKISDVRRIVERRDAGEFL